MLMKVALASCPPIGRQDKDLRACIEDDSNGSRWTPPGAVGLETGIKVASQMTRHARGLIRFDR
jgi:hypothetical protein